MYLYGRIIDSMVGDLDSSDGGPMTAVLAGRGFYCWIPVGGIGSFRDVRCR